MILRCAQCANLMMKHTDVMYDINYRPELETCDKCHVFGSMFIADMSAPNVIIKIIKM